MKNTCSAEPWLKGSCTYKKRPGQAKYVLLVVFIALSGKPFLLFIRESTFLLLMEKNFVESFTLNNLDIHVHVLCFLIFLPPTSNKRKQVL